MNPNLKEAEAIFKTLGWHDAALKDIMGLPDGTPEQKRAALAGLKSGEWGEFAATGQNTYGWRSYIEADRGKLALFAVRVGVDARRAANILHVLHVSQPGDNDIIVQVITERGKKYALDFVGHACTSRRRPWEHAASVFGNLAVRIVDKLGLDIPLNVDYIKDWAVYAAAAMGLKSKTRHRETDLPGLDLIEKRFAEHILAGMSVNAPATGPFGAVLPAGVKRGWLAREKAAELVFTALDASVRPGDRKVWLDVLDEFGVSADEFRARTQALIPLLASSDNTVISRLAPVLIEEAGGLLTEILLASFSAPTQKTKQLLLKSALGQPRPEKAEELASWLSLFTSGKDKRTASLASQLIEKWKLTVEVLPEEENTIQGLWQETPPVWVVPQFGLGQATHEALTDIAAELAGRAEFVYDITAERFLALVNDLARIDPKATRTSLRGVRTTGSNILNFVVSWVKGEDLLGWFDDCERLNYSAVRNVLTARDFFVSSNLGKLPCVLSTPSRDDLSISVPDLALRLETYKKTGTPALEADLLLALARLDTGTKTPEALEALKKLVVPITTYSGGVTKNMKLTAGQTVLAYLDDPVKEPGLIASKHGFWRSEGAVMPESLREFPDRLNGTHNYQFFTVFPHWGDAALQSIRWNSEVYNTKGLVMRQAARRRLPLTPGASVNFLAAFRSSDHVAAEDVMLALNEIWERGLLRPGVADTAYLDWTTSAPSNLAALAAAFDNITKSGLLSVVWPVLDDLFAFAVKAPRLPAGLAELSELALTLLPEVQSAVEKGLTGGESLHMPGLRALAKHGGSSRAVSAAQKAALLLPPLTEPETETPAQSFEMEQPFEKVWPIKEEGQIELLDDGGTITIDWDMPDSSKKALLFKLALPDITDRVFHIVIRWYYGLENEGQCKAVAVRTDDVRAGEIAGEKAEKNTVWLHWDADKNAMVAEDSRDWIKKVSGTAEAGVSSRARASIKKPPLSSSLLTVIIGLLAQDGDAIYFAPRLLKQFIEEGQINSAVVRKAAKTLLQNPAVSPAKLVRALEKEITLLPVLWPMLTESIKTAGALAADGGKPPVWVNRVLDVTLRYAPYLTEAVRRGLIPPEDAKWEGLSAIKMAKGKSAAAEKATRLAEQETRRAEQAESEIARLIKENEELRANQKS